MDFKKSLTDVWNENLGVEWKTIFEHKDGFLFSHRIILVNCSLMTFHYYKQEIALIWRQRLKVDDDRKESICEK